MKIAISIVTALALASCVAEDNEESELETTEQSVQEPQIDSCRLIVIPAYADPWTFCRAQGCVGFYQYPINGGTPICTGSTLN